MRTKLQGLIDKWREYRGDYTDEELTDYGKTTVHTHELLATELENALPKWTRITEDEATWPEQSNDVLLSVGVGFLEAGEWGVQVNDSAAPMDKSIQRYIGRYWRPLYDLDYPPQED